MTARHRLTPLLALLALLVAGPARALPVDGPAPRRVRSAQSAQNEVDARAGAEEEEGGDSWIVLPVVFYSPETELGGSLSAGWFTRWEGDRPADRASSVLLLTAYTMRDQASITLHPDFYFDRGRWHLRAEGGFYRFPDLFFGVGNDTAESAEESFTLETGYALVRAGLFALSRLEVGLLAELRGRRVREREAGGQLAAEAVRGATGGLLSGLGYALAWDSRDNTFTPTRGVFLEHASTFFAPAFGSDETFGRHTLDARVYLPTWLGQALALQVFAALGSGQPPFDQMGILGGHDGLRGVYEGRYRDRHMLTAQLEYRLPVVWRFGLTAFFGVGQVAATLDDFHARGFHPAGGFGVRFLLVEKERVNLRLDAAWSAGGPAAYVFVGEAF